MELLRELDGDYVQLEDLIARINRTNNATQMGSGTTLSDLLAKRDCLKGKLGGLRNFLNNASAMVHRHSASEIKIRSTVNVRQMQKQVDALSKELRELEETIQEKNWTTELLYLQVWLREKRMSSPMRRGQLAYCMGANGALPSWVRIPAFYQARYRYTRIFMALWSVLFIITGRRFCAGGFGETFEK